MITSYDEEFPDGGHVEANWKKPLYRRIFRKTRQRGRFAGFSLYISNTSGIEGSTLRCYKDGPQLPPLNFTAVCTVSGRYVIFFNERLDETPYPKGYQLQNVFTELCEVIIEECGIGLYGEKCTQQCSGNCKDNETCNHVTGQCDNGCTTGWKGDMCDNGCPFGHFGRACKESCNEHCLQENSTLCNHVGGECLNGCKQGYIGTHCNNCKKVEPTI
uniref:Scavenger receptor class F member 2 n=1 Tax=Magallana gigas TaxID=29159 RepID=K1R3Y1_MAGGI